MIPTCALLNELLNGMWCLLAGNKLIFVDDAYTRVGETETNTQVSILSETALIPPTQLFHQFTSHEYGIAPKGGHSNTRKEMHG